MILSRKISKLISRVSVLALGLFAAGCQSMPFASSQSATIPVHSQESLVELRQAVKQLLNGRDVLVSASAFTKSNRLIIQRKPIIGPGGRVIDTRVDEKPMIFELVMADDECYVKRMDTEQTIRLTRANCQT